MRDPQPNRSWPIAALSLVVSVLGFWSGSATAGNLPFVGCPSDGQQGPQRSPKYRLTPAVLGNDAARLAYYAMEDGTGVIAPRGWRCFGRYGSNGSTLTVAPAPDAWAVHSGKSRYVGLAVLRSTSFGSTSGRFEVAAFAARLFPVAAKFVSEIEGEGSSNSFPRGVPPADRIARRGDDEVLFTTPAKASGTGTRGHLAPGALPIDGIAILAADQDHALDTMDARLPAAIRPLVAHIIKQMEREVGADNRRSGG